MWAVYAMAYTDFWKLLHKNAIKREFQEYRCKFWGILEPWRTLTFEARGAPGLDEYYEILILNTVILKKTSVCFDLKFFIDYVIVLSQFVS